MKQLSRGGLRPQNRRPERLLRQLQAEARAAQPGQPPAKAPPAQNQQAAPPPQS